MDLLPQNIDGCPYLLLAPMEGLADQAFRKAIATIGGFDEACTEFIRVPANAHIDSLAKVYNASELGSIPIAAQLMGSEPGSMAEMTHAIAEKGAQRIEINCGCPSNTVTGKGAGSSLLKSPESLYLIAKSMVDAVNIPITAKLRAGFSDTSLFKENLLAAQESGIQYLTLHPRTKLDGYHAPAKWELIAEAKQLLKIPVVGNGDIKNVSDALSMLKQTKCDALMIGRGSVTNPWLFQQIKCHFSGKPFVKTWEELKTFFNKFILSLPDTMTHRGRINKLKQLGGFIFQENRELEKYRMDILRGSYLSIADFTNRIFPILENFFQ